MKKPSKKILKCLKKILSETAYFRCAPNEGNAISFNNVEKCTVRLHGSQNYGNLGKGYLVYICDENKYKQGIFNWFYFIVEYDDFVKKYEVTMYEKKKINVDKLIKS